MEMSRMRHNKGDGFLMSDKKKEMPFAYSAVSDLYYATFRKLRSTHAKVSALESDLDRYKKAMTEFNGGADE